MSLLPAAVTARSLRGISTLKTASFSFHFPLSPVSCSIRAVSRPFLAAAAGKERSANAMSMVVMVHLLCDSPPWIRGHLFGTFEPPVHLFPGHVLDEGVHLLPCRGPV